MTSERLVSTMEKVLYPVSRLLNYVGIGSLSLLMLLVTIHVIGRYLLGLPIPGSVELIELLMVLVVFLGLADCAVHHGNVSVSLFVDRLSKRAQAVIDVFTCLLSIVIVSLITWQSAEQVRLLLQSGHASGALRIPHWPFAIVMTIGWAALNLVLVLHFIEFLIKVFKK